MKEIQKVLLKLFVEKVLVERVLVEKDFVENVLDIYWIITP